MVETNVHFPTDLNLLWNAARKSIELLHALGTDGWRKAKDWKKKLKSLMRSASKISAGGGQNKDQRTRQIVGAYLAKARELDAKVAASLDQLNAGARNPLDLIKRDQISYFHQHLRKHIDLVERRLLRGEKIPHEEKVFSLFEPHTEWITKGKSRPPVELGHQLLLTTDQHQLIVDYRVMEKSSDAAETMPLAHRVLARLGENSIASWSFDQGFSRQSHRVELEELVDLVVMPKKGQRSEADRQRESAAPFVKKKRAHSAVESNINSLEHHGLDRCPDHGLAGYQRYVGLGVLAYNLHRLGQEKLARQRNARASRDKPAPGAEELAKYEQAMAA